MRFWALVWKQEPRTGLKRIFITVKVLKMVLKSITTPYLSYINLMMTMVDTKLR